MAGFLCNSVVWIEYSVNKKVEIGESDERKMFAWQVTGIVYRVNCNENIKNRIFDFGIMENSPVIPLFTSPFGDPSAYLVKNAVVALRNNDCKDIIVTPE